jgi:lysophospholipase
MTPDKRHLRGAVWDLPEGAAPRGICVLLNWLTEFLEKYGEVADELTARGFIVVSLDWRSQGASERWRSSNRASHVASFEEYDRDLAALLLQAVEPIQRTRETPLPVIGLAHSMGAHILLRFLHEHPRRFAAAALISPMLEIQTGQYSPGFTKLMVTVHNLRRPSTRFIYGVEERDPLELAFADNRVTSDEPRYERTRALLKAQPFLRIYGPTFGWLGAAFQSVARMMRRGFAEDIATPLLIVGAGKDRVVHTPAVRDFVKRLPNVRYVEIENAEHEILMETDSIRNRFWAEFDAFVETQLNTPQGRFGAAQPPLL